MNLQKKTTYCISIINPNASSNKPQMTTEGKCEILQDIEQLDLVTLLLGKHIGRYFLTSGGKNSRYMQLKTEKKFKGRAQRMLVLVPDKSIKNKDIN